MRVRILSATVMIPVAIGAIALGGAVFTVLVALVGIGMAWEWVRMCRAAFAPPTVLMFAALPLAIMVAATGHVGLSILLLLAVTLAAFLRPQPAAHDRLLPLGLPYLGLGAIALTWLRIGPPDGFALLVTLLLVIWASDIGAYLVGRVAGGPKLAPRISPGKTWSGAVGGLAASMAIGALAAPWIGAGDRIGHAALLAGLVGCVGQAGDLLESGLKRRFAVKDSSALIPGHGGLLDRLDAVLTAAPLAAILALVLERGVIHW
ncbi:phosphatidate cytidylyltransferase [Rhodopila sp.]|uniref:phosphatidate cytidylyltransferase n=1 Tax=Rhodopila sp. TaxID=2480087 RepID=UPI002D09169A|nr:phosphatidate cytidylyltransferase [Rhodopila sp.]HVZ07832.1 phosphatidate cytidylyltransferase [Rhodopila sp.]